MNGDQLTLFSADVERCLRCGAPFRWMAAGQRGRAQWWRRYGREVRGGVVCVDDRACEGRRLALKSADGASDSIA